MKLIRLVSVIIGAAIAIGFTLHQSQAAASPSTMSAQSASAAPVLSVQPNALTFLAEVTTPTRQTQTLFFANTTPPTLLTWTIAIRPSNEVQPIVSPITGTNDATVTVRIDTGAITASGTYTANLIVAAEQTVTIGSPITIPINVIAVEQLNRIFLPLTFRNYPPPSPQPMQMGLTFVSAPEWNAPEERYQKAAGANARLNRWPMYWYEIERDAANHPRQFTWDLQDANVIRDIDHGLAINTILLGTPPGLDTGGNRLAPKPRVGIHYDRLPLGPNRISSVASPPQGLFLSVFDDNSDEPGSTKSINPNNRWAVFVNAAVNRYKPGGILAQSQSWSGDKGIRYWEIWNEPDFDLFFTGTITDYARLLKVAYLSAKFADPQAQIILGGMAHWQQPNWFTSVLDTISGYSDASANHYFMDDVASHNYSWAWQTFWYLFIDRTNLDARGLTNVGLWLTETGISTCDDPPGFGQRCDDPINSMYRGTIGEQADYLIQSATFAAWLKAEAFIWFQLYDDAGNGCDSRDGFGLVRNPSSGPCYSGDGSPRPSYTAYQIAASLLSNAQPYWRKRPTINQELIAFKRPLTGERLIVMWARDYVTETVTLTATGSSATLMFPNGITQTLVPISSTYTIELPAATNDNTPTADGKAPIGGSPRILIEVDPAITP